MFFSRRRWSDRASQWKRFVRLKPPEHGYEQFDREQPDEEDLPKTQVARCPMIGRDVRVPTKVALAISKNVNAARKDEYETDAEEDSQGQNRITMGMDGGQVHFSPKIACQNRAACQWKASS